MTLVDVSDNTDTPNFYINILIISSHKYVVDVDESNGLVANDNQMS